MQFFQVMFDLMVEFICQYINRLKLFTPCKGWIDVFYSVMILPSTIEYNNMYEISSFESCILYIYLFFTLTKYIMDLNIIQAYNGHVTVHFSDVCQFPQIKIEIFCI